MVRMSEEEFETLKLNQAGKIKVAAEKKVKANKFGAIKKTVDGFKFDSTKEAGRYSDLKLLMKAGHVITFECQVCFYLPAGIRYYLDFLVFWDDGQITFEDVKGGNATKTPVYKLKKKLFQCLYNEEITEI